MLRSFVKAETEIEEILPGRVAFFLIRPSIVDE